MDNIIKKCIEKGEEKLEEKCILPKKLGSIKNLLVHSNRYKQIP